MDARTASIFERYGIAAGHFAETGAGADVRVRLDEGDGMGTVRLENGTGSAVMLFCEVFPGVTFSYNDFRMERCASSFTTSDTVFCIDHCLEGRIEQPMPGGACSYVSAGDVKIDDRSNHTGLFELPLGRYRGVTVSFDLPAAQASVESALGGFPVDIAALRGRFCRGGVPFISHRCPGAEHVFSELYDVPESVRAPYLKIKVLELLLFLQTMEDVAADERPYFPHAQVEKVKAAHGIMHADLSAPHTVEALAHAVDMPLTAFKACFKGVYGMPVATYLRCARIEQATRLLRETDLNVAEIGAAVGYSSPSKFSSVFRVQTGQTPRAYRREA